MLFLCWFIASAVGAGIFCAGISSGLCFFSVKGTKENDKKNDVLITGMIRKIDQLNKENSSLHYRLKMSNNAVVALTKERQQLMDELKLRCADDLKDIVTILPNVPDNFPFGIN